MADPGYSVSILMSKAIFSMMEASSDINHNTERIPMIKVDLSKAVPADVCTYLLPLIPGIFFGFSVALGDPQLIATVVGRMRSGYPFNAYSLVFAALFAAFVVGHAFYISAWYIQRCLTFVYRIFLRLRKRTVNALFQRLSRRATIPRQRWLRILHLHQLNLNEPRRLREVRVCWGIAATQLLRVRHGIDRRESIWRPQSHEWEVWHAVLGVPPRDFRVSFLIMQVLCSTGLAGIVAVSLSPYLRNRFYISFSILLLATATWQAFDLAAWRNDPVKDSLLKLRGVLGELQNVADRNHRNDRGRDSEANEILTSDEAETN